MNRSTSSRPQWLTLPRLDEIRRGERASPEQPLVLTQNRIFVLPTGQGLWFGILMVVMLLGAVNYNNSMAFMLAFLLASVAMVSVLHTYLNLAGLHITPVDSHAAFAGGQATFVLQLTNPGPRRRFTLSLRPNHSGGETYADVAPNDAHRLTLAVQAPQRGPLRLGTVVISSRYPLGLVRAWSYVNVDATALVYPKPWGQDAIVRGRGDGDAGHTTDEPGSDDFHGLRDYQRGDSPRHLHWKSWARNDVLLTKQFRAERSPDLWLDWADAQGDDELRLSQLCRWVIQAQADGQRYGLRLPGKDIAPDSGLAHQHRCLAALALYTRSAPT